MYGAGNIGRGFIGQLFAASGYEVTFIDVAEPVINAINRDGKYPVRLLSSSGHEDIWVDGVKAVNGKDVQKAARAIAEADIMATAVGVRVLPFIAPVLAEGIRNRFAQTKAPLNIIICENLIDANKLLEKLIKEKLSADEIKLFDERVGLVEASIGRMVPLQTQEMQAGNPFRVCTEYYGFLPVDKDAFKGEIPEIKNMKPFSCFDFYIQRKLFIHNMGHAVCAYLGMLKADTFIYETVKRGGIVYIAQNAMMESALALSAKFKIPIKDIYFHIKDLLNRFSNKALGDTCARVGGDTVRKLGVNDRIIGAINCCNAMGVSPGFIRAGAGAALYCHLKEKNLPQTADTAASALEEVSGIAKGSAEAGLILGMYELFAKGAEFSEVIKAATEASNKKDVI
jgi:mannitol-1-phosphate 5-dehydrogenase